MAAANDSKKAGSKTRLSFQRVQIDGKWFAWDEFNDRLTPAKDSPRPQGKKTRHFSSKTTDISADGSNNQLSPEEMQCT